jgi:hypothetical protein
MGQGSESIIQKIRIWHYVDVVLYIQSEFLISDAVVGET